MPLHEQPVVRQRTNDNELCYCGNWCLFCCRMYIRTEKWAFRSTFYLFIYVKYYQRTDYIIATKVRVNWYDLNESMFRLIWLKFQQAPIVVFLHLFLCVGRFDANEGNKTHIPNNTTVKTTHRHTHTSIDSIYRYI